ncbi:MAG: hypothetical protein M3R50_08225 [Bacteroidota bacterium]|nr:hypothetical protein [Bacteroidota bacterium]
MIENFTGKRKVLNQMKRFFLFATTLFAFNTGAIGQLTLQANIPPVGFIQKGQLWNILVVNNSAVSHNCKLNLSLKERNTGQDVLNATTGFFNISKGALQLSENILNPIQYNYISAGASAHLQGLLPVGAYTACYTLTEASEEVELAENCFEFDVEPLSPPLLAFPADSTQSEAQPLQFIWMPPTPAGMFSRLHYEILITGVNDNQKADEAIQQNIPFYNTGDIVNNTLSYSGNNLSFEKDKWYAWQIIARDDNSYAAKSEAWVFKVDSPSVEKIVLNDAPYLKMKKSGPEKGMAPNGILKLSYVNETTDSIATILITDLNGDKQSLQFKTPVHAGENLILYDVSKKLGLKEGIIYKAQVTNSRKEVWAILFEIHFFKDKGEQKN